MQESGHDQSDPEESLAFPAANLAAVNLQAEQFSTLDSIDRTEFPYFSDFLRLYPNASVSYQPAGQAVLIYQAKATVHDRYELKFEIPVFLSGDGKEIEKFGDLRSGITEVESIKEEDGGIYTSWGDSHEIMDLEKLFKANGDFSVVELDLIKDRPVENIQLLREMHKLQHRDPH